MTQYQPYTYGSPNVPTINPLEVVGTSYYNNRTSNVSGSGKKIGQLAKKLIQKRKEEEQAEVQKQTEAENAKEVAENVANTEETRNAIENIETETEVPSAPVVEPSAEATTISAENEDIEEDIGEGDIE